jgi:hypothetical protein
MTDSLNRDDLRGLKEDISGLFDAKLVGVTQLLERHDRRLEDHNHQLQTLTSDVAVSKSKVRGLSAVVSIVVSAAVTTVLKALKL